MSTTATEDGDSTSSTARRRSARAGRWPTDHGLRDDRCGGRRHRHHRVRRRDRHSRHRRRRPDPEDGAEHVTDRRDRVHGLPRAKGEPDRQGGRRLLHARDRHDVGDPLHLHHDGRGDAAPPRRVHQLCEEAHASSARRSARTSTSRARSSTRRSASRTPASTSTTPLNASREAGAWSPRSPWRSWSRARRTSPRRSRPCRSSGARLHARSGPRERASRRRRCADILGHKRDAAHPDRVDARPHQAGMEVILRGDR